MLLYNLDEARMVQRFVSNPRKVFLDIALELNKLAAFGMEKRHAAQAEDIHRAENRAPPDPA